MKTMLIDGFLRRRRVPVEVYGDYVVVARDALEIPRWPVDGGPRYQVHHAPTKELMRDNLTWDAAVAYAEALNES